MDVTSVITTVRKPSSEVNENFEVIFLIQRNNYVLIDMLRSVSQNAIETQRNSELYEEA